jgi:hypothetical protein
VLGTTRLRDYWTTGPAKKKQGGGSRERRIKQTSNPERILGRPMAGSQLKARHTSQVSKGLRPEANAQRPTFNVQRSTSNAQWQEVEEKLKC